MKAPPKPRFYEPWVVEDTVKRVLMLEAILENLHPLITATHLTLADREQKSKILEQLYKLMPWIKSN
jgi:hypothetical protein